MKKLNEILNEAAGRGMMSIPRRALDSARDTVSKKVSLALKEPGLSFRFGTRDSNMLSTASIPLPLKKLPEFLGISDVEVRVVENILLTSGVVKYTVEVEYSAGVTGKSVVNKVGIIEIRLKDSKVLTSF